MKKFCPLSLASNIIYDCSDRCMMYSLEKGGCIIKKALTAYIDEHKPVSIHEPTEGELNRIAELLKETLAQHTMKPVVFNYSNSDNIAP